MPLKSYRPHPNYIDGRNYLLKISENNPLLNGVAGAGALVSVDGHPTIGYGWDITVNSYNATISAFADANISLSASQKDALQQYKSGSMSASGLIRAWNGIDLSDAQATSLLNVAAEKFETAYSNSLGSSDVPQSFERAALISQLYNIGVGGAPTEHSLILSAPADAKAGYKQHEEIWYQIGFNSDSLGQGAGVVHGLEVRRLREADTFALYTNGGSPTDDDEAKSIFQVVGDHGNASGLINYLTARGYSAVDARAAVNSRLQAAATYLEQHHLKIGSIDNYDNIQVADDSIGRTVLAGGEGDGLLFAEMAAAVLKGGTGNYSIYGGAGGDTLIGGSGLNFLDGGGGTDRMVARGQETHMVGGLGDDSFAIGSNTWIEDTLGRDTVSYGGITVYGGTKQWWMEGNKAYWAPFTTLMAAFPVIGSELLYTASFFIDVQTMKFATYMLAADGTLLMNLGWGHGGTAAVKDYHLDLDTGIGSASLAVFTSGHGGTSTADSGGMTRLQHFVNLALKAAWGHGLYNMDPLVLDLDGDGYELTTEANSHTYFEFDHDGFGERTGWLRGGDDGFLVRDANGNGNIDDVTELFGNATTSGFAMLGVHDVNQDGQIDASDAVYSELRVWRDANGNAVVDTGELKSLAELGIVSLSLANSAPADPTDVGGNAIVHTGHFTRADGSTGGLADVALAINETASRWLGDATVSASAAALPQLTGVGEIKDLRVAMTGDAGLEAMVSGFAGLTTNDLPTLKSAAEAILYKWAGVDAVAATSIGDHGFDARKLAFLEKYTGYELMPRDAGGAVLTTNLGEMETLWADQVTRLTLRLVVQGPMADDFAGISYRADLDLLVADTPTALGDLYHRLLADLPSDPAAALAQWQGWAPLLGAMAEGMRRFDANLVRGDYVAAQLLAATDGATQPLSYAQLAGALGIENLRLGTSGNDSVGRAGANGTAVYVMEGGGTDAVTGGAGQDVYIFGRTIGHATITDVEARAGGDRIRFAFLSHDAVTMARDGADLLITVKATGETVRVVGQFADVVPLSSDLLLSPDRGIEDIQFADGAVWEMPEIMTAVGTGTDGNDHMIGTMHSDVLIGGKGDDLLEGGDDADLYVIKDGDGHDIIHDQQSTPLLRAADLLIFGGNIAPEDVHYSRAGNAGDDLLITIGSTGQTVTIQGEFDYTSLGYNDRLAPNSRIESFAFENYGDSFGNKDLQQRLIAEATTDGNDTTRGFGDSDEFGESAGNDLLIGMDGVDGYHWGPGAGNDTIYEQARYIDINVGLGGLSLVDGADTVLFDAGIVRSDLVFSRTTSAPDLTITLLSTGETLTVKNQFDGFQTGPLGPQWMDRIEWFQFADGSRLSWQDVLRDITTGVLGNDSLWGDLYADTMDGGAGDDVLSGGGLGDTYVFKLGYGHDTLVDDNQFILGSGFVTVDASPDVLSFGPGIAPSDIHFVRSGPDLTLVLGTGGDSVTLKGQDDYFHTGVFGAISYNRIEQVRFDDGTVWTWQDVNRLALADATTPDNDTAQGFMMADRFEASAGDDLMMGGDSSDTYVFGHGSGHDIVRESVSNVLYGDDDVVEFGPDVTPDQVSVQRVGEDLVFTLAGTGDTLKIEREFGFDQWFTWNDVEQFRFADGTVWTKDDLQVRLMQSTSGDDHIIGFMTPDTIDGGAGNDLLEGADGGDTYLFGRGSGHDEIRESVSTANLSEYDTLRFGAGVTLADLGWTRQGSDLVVTILDTGDSVRVVGQFDFYAWFTWTDIDAFAFADGTTLSRTEIQQFLLTGTPGDDHLIGFSDDDTLDGGAGNDILEGGDGGDTYLFGRGYGHDEIREWVSTANLSEYDTLRFGAGVSLADIGWVRDGADLIVTILPTGDTMRVTGEFSYSNWFTWNDVDNFAFAEGTSLSRIDVQQILLQGTSGNDHLVGFLDADLIDGGAGNDLLEGGDGGDTYVFGRGYGQDVVVDWLSNANLSEYDTIRFTAGIAQSDLYFSRDGGDLVVTIAGTTDSIRVKGQFDDRWTDVDNFVFADGTSLSAADVALLALRGTPGDDHLVGFNGDDTLDGGAGNDILEGGEGADTYVFGRGYGHDIVRGEYVWDTRISEDDRVLFGTNVTIGDLAFSRSGADLTITILGTSDSLTVENQFGDETHDVDHFVLADGTVLSKVDVQNLILRGTPGDDHIVGFATADVMTGGAGNDLLEGGGGADTYVFGDGSGSDTVTDTSGGDSLSFTGGLTQGLARFGFADAGRQDLLVSFAGRLETVKVTGFFSGGATISSVAFAGGTSLGFGQVVEFAFATIATAGNDSITGPDFGVTLSGLAGNDTLVGRHGDDTLVGGIGDDLLTGSGGNDTYRFARGDGNDVVRDYGSAWDGWGGSDTVEFASGIAPSDVIVTEAGGGADLVLTVNNAGGSVTLDDTMTNGDDRIEQVRFADGTVWSHADLVARAAAGTAGDDTLWGSYDGETIATGAGNDTVDARGGNDVLVGGVGNDLLSGSGGDDTYRFACGDGNDVVRDFVSSYSGWGGNDTIEFLAGIAPSDVTVTQGDNGNDLVLTVNNAGGSITIDDTMNNGDQRIEQVRFADGTVWTSADLVARVTGGTTGNDTIWGSSDSNTITGGGGNDTIDARGGNDTIAGGAGDDFLSGSGGDDTFLFDRGDGNDVVRDFVNSFSGWGGNDAIRFGAGIAPVDVRVTQVNNGTDLLLTVNNNGGSILIDDALVNGDDKIEQVIFADGTVWTHDQLVALSFGATDAADTINGDGAGNFISAGPGNDWVDGRGGDDVIIGGTGDDFLAGSGGNDTYRFAYGDGNDVIQDYINANSGWGGNDTVEFLAGIAPADVTVTQFDSGTDLVLTVANGGGSIRLVDTMVNGDDRIEQVKFADGTVWSHAQMVAMTTGGTPGNDTLWGSYDSETVSPGSGNDWVDGRGGDDVIVGGTGDDFLAGSGGNDTYRFAYGDGNDVIQDYINSNSGWGGIDTVQFLAGIAPADVTVTQADSGTDLLLTVANGGGSIRLTDTMVNGDQRIEQVKFADGTVWSHAQMVAMTTGGTPGNDTLWGSYDSETVSPGSGNDWVDGRGGDDVIVGGTGDDFLAGSGGNDTYRFAYGDGNDVIQDYINSGSGWGGNDTVEFFAGIAPADVAVSQADSGTDLVLTVANGGGSIRLVDTMVNGDQRIEQVRFADGTVWTHANLVAKTSSGTSGNDTLWGSYDSETIAPGAGNDWVDARGGDDVIVGGTGDDFMGGSGGNDTYQFNVGDGHDTIQEYLSSFSGWGGTDRVVFGNGIAPSDITVARTADGGGYELFVGAGADQLTLVGAATWGSDYAIEEIRFVDGTVWTRTELEARIGTVGNGSDYFGGTASADNVRGLSGNDTLEGAAGDDTLRGDGGDDTLAGGDGNDTLTGGAGNDLLVGDYRVDTGANLVVNGSFETYSGVLSSNSGGPTVTTLAGWTKSNVSPYELVNSTSGVTPTDGTYWLDMDGYRPDSNMVISQTIGGRVGGELLDLRFDLANRNSIQSGTMDVLWNGVVVASIGITGTTMQSFSIPVTALDGNNVLTFRGTGVADDWGASLDNVRLFATSSGTAGDDQLTGGAGSDVAQGGAGNDTYYFNRGDGADSVAELPGEGALDRLVLGADIAPTDLAFATAANGRDVVMTIAGGSDSITFIGGMSNPVIGFEEFRFADGTAWDQPTIESHIARYTAGPDTITGTSGNDTLRGGGGDDTLSGAAGNDTLYGDDGNDTLDGGLGNDALNGLEGDDRLVFSAGNDDYRGGNGIDTLDLSTAGSAATVDLSAASNQLIVGGVSSQVSGVETVLGSGFNDSLTGDAGANRLDGGAGVDTLVGGGGDDTLIGGLGDDIFQYSGAANGFDALDGGAGTDTIQAMTAGTTIGLSTVTGVEAISAGALANVTVSGSANADTLDFTAVTLTGIARIDGGAGNDTITGSTANDDIAGGAGDDTLAGGAGNDIFDYAGMSEGFDAVDGGAGTNTIRATASTTYIGLRSLTNVQTITANGFSDVHVTGSAAADIMNYAAITLTGIAKIEGLAGDDTITGTALADTIDGGDGNDTISGGAGDDNVAGGLGNDTFKLAGASDGFDAIDGGAGTDTIQATAANAVLSLRSVVGVETVTANGLTGVSIAGSAGNDSLDFSLSTLVGITKIDAGAGNDVVLGSAAAETIVGGAGDDALNGGGGNDTFQVTGSTSGFDAIDGGAGTDTIQAMAASTVIGLTSIAGIETITAGTFTGVYISGSGNADTLDFTAVTTMTGIGRIDGGAGNDTITGSGLADVIVGGAGDDTLAGGAGNDTFQVSGTAAGFDAVDGGAGTDTISATAASTVIGLRSLTGVETISGGSFTGVYIQGSGGDDVLNFLAVTLTAITKVDGGAGNDTITGNSAANTLFGGIGNDVLNGDAGIDTLNGDDGDDTIAGGLGNDTINGGNGLDTVDYTYSTTAWTVNLAATSSQGVSSKETDTISNVENVIGSGLADTITGTATVNVLKGGAGNDRITGGGGNDSIDGGVGTDIAVFAGLKASYTVVTSGGTIQIADTQATTDGDDGTDTLIGVETAEFKGGVQLTLAPPIIIDLDGDGVNLVDRFTSGATFDWNGDGLADRTGWMGRGDGMLVFDRDHDGTVSGAGELSFIDDKPGAKSDLDGLSAFDSNHDGIFSALDSAWSEFRVWRDSDGDGEVDGGEFLTMEGAGVAAISLSGAATEQSWGMTDNILINEGSFVRTDGSGGALADVALNYFAATPFFRHLRAEAVVAEQDYAHRGGERHGVLPFFVGGSDHATSDALPAAFALPVVHAGDEAGLRAGADPSGLA